MARPGLAYLASALQQVLVVKVGAEDTQQLRAALTADWEDAARLAFLKPSARERRSARVSQKLV